MYIFINFIYFYFCYKFYINNCIMFFCRATNALISVRLDYNNLRKKYRNFWFLFCSFGLFFYSSFSPLRSPRLLSLYVSHSFFFFSSLTLFLFLPLFLSFTRSPANSLILSLPFSLSRIRPVSFSPKHDRYESYHQRELPKYVALKTA